MKKRLKNLRRKIDRNRIYVLVLIAIAAVICVTFFVLTTRRMEEVYSNQMYENALETRKVVLSDTVQNLLKDLDNQRSEQTAYYRDLTDNVLSDVKAYAAGEDFAAGVSEYFENVSGVSCFSYLVYDTKNGRVSADVGGLNDAETAKGALVVSNEFTNGNFTCVYGVKKDYVDTVVKNAFLLRVESYEFSDGASVWVKDAKDYDGENESDLGDGFVARDKKTLSYVAEYPDYDWVVGMDVSAQNIVDFVSEAHAANRPLIMRYTILVSVLFVIVFLLCMVFILSNDRRKFKQRVRHLRHEVEIDELTGANTRKYGNRLMEEAYLDFRETGDSVALMLLDVDKFKSVNDTYGHDAGDEVLKKVVSVMKQNMRREDCLIRWGGDEFVGIFPDLTRSELEAVAKKLLFAVSDFRIMAKDENDEPVSVKVTISLGFTYFREEDSNYQDALKRADSGLYESKSGGRNQYNITI